MFVGPLDMEPSLFSSLLEIAYTLANKDLEKQDPAGRLPATLFMPNTKVGFTLAYGTPVCACTLTGAAELGSWRLWFCLVYEVERGITQHQMATSACRVRTAGQSCYAWQCSQVPCARAMYL